MSLIETLREILNTKITLDTLKAAAYCVVTMAETAVPGADGMAKKAWAKEQLLEAIEDFDQLIPLVGPWMELPWVDGLEKSLVDMAVEWGWSKLQVLKALNPTQAVTDAPELPSGSVE